MFKKTRALIMSKHVQMYDFKKYVLKTLIKQI